MRAIALLAAALALAGCVTNRQTMKTAFDADALAFGLGQGTAAIGGQAYYRQPTGGVVTVDEGTYVVLFPRSAYSAETVAKLKADPTTFPDVTNFDQRLAAYIRRTPVVMGGTFVFTGVPAGTYYLMGAVKTQTPAIIAGYHEGFRLLIQTVHVDDGQTLRVDLNG